MSYDEDDCPTAAMYQHKRHSNSSEVHNFASPTTFYFIIREEPKFKF